MIRATARSTYTPDPDFTGTDTFTYTVSDGNGGLGYQGTVTVTVDPVNDQRLWRMTTTPSGDAARRRPISVDVLVNGGRSAGRRPADDRVDDAGTSNGSAVIDDGRHVG